MRYSSQLTLSTVPSVPPEIRRIFIIKTLKLYLQCTCSVYIPVRGSLRIQRVSTESQCRWTKQFLHGNTFTPYLWYTVLCIRGSLTQIEFFHCICRCTKAAGERRGWGHHNKLDKKQLKATERESWTGWYMHLNSIQALPHKCCSIR